MKIHNKAIIVGVQKPSSVNAFHYFRIKKSYVVSCLLFTFYPRRFVNTF